MEVGLLFLSAHAGERAQELFRRKVMARVIEFYVPARFKPKVKWVPQELRGKIICFPLELKKSA